MPCLTLLIALGRPVSNHFDIRDTYQCRSRHRQAWDILHSNASPMSISLAETVLDEAGQWKIHNSYSSSGADRAQVWVCQLGGPLWSLAPLGGSSIPLMLALAPWHLCQGPLLRLPCRRGAFADVPVSSFRWAWGLGYDRLSGMILFIIVKDISKGRPLECARNRFRIDRPTPIIAARGEIMRQNGVAAKKLGFPSSP